MKEGPNNETAIINNIMDIKREKIFLGIRVSAIGFILDREVFQSIK